MSTRRRFLQQLGLASGLLLAPRILARDGAPWLSLPPAGRPLRLRGRVRHDGRGIAGAVVSDGLRAIRCDDDGYFEFISSSERPFAFLRLPAGCRIPTSPTGTARFYHPLGGRGDDVQLLFDVETRSGGDSEHGFLVLADPQILDDDDATRMHAETVPDIRRTLRGLGDLPVFGAACGDIVYDRPRFYPDYELAIAACGLPSFQVVGNHDADPGSTDNRTALQNFGRHFGPNYYSFDRGEIHYVVLDDVFTTDSYVGAVDEAQLRWLRADLAHVEAGGRVVVFVHIPPWNTSHLRQGYEAPSENKIVVNRDRLYEALAGFETTFICGHMHENEYLRDGGCDIHVCGAVCGAWWTGDICGDGSPNGYSVYTAHGSELRWRYKGVGRPDEYRFEVIEDTPDGVPILNVWEATDAWRIVCFEDGEARGPLERFTGLDPRAVATLEGDDRPAKHGWAEPDPTNHLFRPRPSTDWRRLDFVVTDPWGVEYRTSVTRSE